MKAIKIIVASPIVIGMMIFAPFLAQAQSGKGHVVMAEVNGSDTIPVIQLKTVSIVTKRKFDSRKAEVLYKVLKKNIYKVYPYAVEVQRVTNKIDIETAEIEKKRKQKKYLKELEEELKIQFEESLKDLTITQGKILMKLIHRQTNQTCYDLVKKYNNGLSAFYWQKLAKLYGSDMKIIYDPEGEDKDIESIVSAIEAGY